MIDNKEEYSITEKDLCSSYKLAEEAKKNSQYDVAGIVVSFVSAFFLAGFIFMVIGVNSIYSFVPSYVFSLIAILSFGSSKKDRELTKQELDKLSKCTKKYRKSLLEYIKNNSKTYKLTWQVIIRFNSYFIKNRDLAEYKGSEKELIDKLKINNNDRGEVS